MTNPYGPWATAIDAGRNPQLSAFWRQRLTMLVPASRTSPVLSRHSLLGLLAAAALVCALPTFHAAPAVAEQEKASPEKGKDQRTDAGGKESAATVETAAREAAERAEKDWQKLPPAERRIREALDQPTQLEFVEAPLNDVLDYLRDLHRIRIRLDDAALKAAGIDQSTPVTETFKDISLRAALEVTLHDLKLRYVVRDGGLLITTGAKEAGIMNSSPTAEPAETAGQNVAGGEAAERRIRAALDEPTDVAYVQTPLKDAVSHLKDLHPIEIRLDVAALKDAGIDPSTPVTESLQGISLRTVLELMLHELKLRYVVRNGVLLITSRERPENPAEAKAVADIEKAGGEVTLSQSPGKAVASVFLYGRKVTDERLLHFASLTQLDSLNLGQTQVTDAGLARLAGLTQLRRLNLQNDKVTDAGLVHLQGLTRLQWLSLGGTQVTDVGLEYLKGLTGLQGLDLQGTQVTDAGLVHLRGLTQLRSLSLGRTRVTDAGLVHLKVLTDLQFLTLGDRITDAGLANLKGLAQLKELALGGTKVTDAGLEHFQGLTRLQRLQLGATGVTDNGLKRLAGWSHLQQLFLGKTQVTDAGLEYLAGLTQFQMLDLQGTQVSDAGLARLKGLTGLDWLNLQGTQVTDAGLKHLKGLTRLQWLDLEHTKVTDAGIEEIERALPDCAICGP